jgi:hypothetical protein
VDEDLTVEEAKDIRNDYNFILRLAANDTTGSVEKFWVDLAKVIQDAKGDTEIIEAYVNRELPKVEYFSNLYGDQAAAEITEAQGPSMAADVNRAIDVKRQDIVALTETYGIVLPEGQLDLLARDAWYNGWERDEIFTNIRPFLEQNVADPEIDLIGRAGDMETDLMGWSARNGLDLSRQAAAKYITNLTVGTQTLDDVKADLRRDYLSGMFPAWADRINDGFDPEIIFQPYKDTASRLLEVENVGYDDPLLKSALQNSQQVSLYDFEKQIRNDPRWQYTDNAFQTYASTGQRIASMFGFG